VAHTAPAHTERSRADWWLLIGLSALPLALSIASTFHASYGYFIDEFYYIACAKRLGFGYVDHPPLAPAILAGTRPLLGDSLLGLRLPAFLAASVTVGVTGLLTWRLGGGRFATTLAEAARSDVTARTWLEQHAPAATWTMLPGDSSGFNRAREAATATRTRATPSAAPGPWRRRTRPRCGVRGDTARAACQIGA
jgi:hypothetical protein